jgi:hypothetical protein
MKLVATALATNPFAVLSLIVMAVEGKSVAMGTQRCALSIIAACQTGFGVFVDRMLTQGKQTQCAQVVIDVAQNVVESLAGISGDFTDRQLWETATQILKAWDGLQMVVAVSGNEGSGDGPESEETIIEDIEGFGLVPKVMLTLRRRGFVFFLALLRALFSLLVVTLVVDVACFWVAWRSPSTVVQTSLSVTITAFFAGLLGSTGAFIQRKETGLAHLGAAHA